MKNKKRGIPTRIKNMIVLLILSGAVVDAKELKGNKQQGDVKWMKN